jgi:hypothetical protein
MIKKYLPIILVIGGAASFLTLKFINDPFWPCLAGVGSIAIGGLILLTRWRNNTKDINNDLHNY